MSRKSRKNRLPIAWAVVALVGGYIFCQALADVAATKIVQIGNVTMPAGTFVFAITFTLRDMLHKRLGREWARAAIVMAGVLNLIMAGYLYWMSRLPAPPFYGLAEAWSSIFAFVPAIVLGSIIAEVVSEWVDTDVYHAVARYFKGPWQFMRVIISNLVSLPLDSLIFGALAFVYLPVIFGAEPMPFAAAMHIVGGQIIFKAIVTAVSLPGIYLVKEEHLLTTASLQEAGN